MRGNGATFPLKRIAKFISEDAAREAAGPSLKPAPFTVLDPLTCSKLGLRWQEQSKRIDTRIKRIIQNVYLLREAEKRRQASRVKILRARIQHDLGRFTRADRLVVASGIGLVVHPDGKVYV